MVQRINQNSNKSSFLQVMKLWDFFSFFYFSLILIIQLACKKIIIRKKVNENNTTLRIYSAFSFIVLYIWIRLTCISALTCIHTTYMFSTWNCW